jgi:hypothetical protein
MVNFETISDEMEEIHSSSLVSEASAGKAMQRVCEVCKNRKDCGH